MPLPFFIKYVGKDKNIEFQKQRLYKSELLCKPGDKFCWRIEEDPGRTKNVAGRTQHSANGGLFFRNTARPRHGYAVRHPL
ncbi:hypothetical protein [Terrimonas pollutisoli]|uniref:hypothetical protein n=1 Tax=Terrimonas pollutisoli TaxID=3034147 RepID=UPI0023ED23E0|nr:hypothetical protein [Terrimonas sp. H1YJ31]